MTKLIHCYIIRGEFNRVGLEFVRSGGQRVCTACSPAEADRLYEYIAGLKNWHIYPSLAAGLWNAARNRN